jgi:hypothetical protein
MCFESFTEHEGFQQSRLRLADFWARVQGMPNPRFDSCLRLAWVGLQNLGKNRLFGGEPPRNRTENPQIKSLSEERGSPQRLCDQPLTVCRHFGALSLEPQTCARHTTIRPSS